MKYLIVKTSSLGDILQSFPVASFLRNKSPYGEISWLVEEKFASLVRAHPEVDHVITMKRRFKIPLSFGLRAKSYDVLFDLQGNCKSALLTLFADAKAKVGFAWKDLAEMPSGFATNVKFTIEKGKNIGEDYLSLAQNYFHDFTPFVAKPFLFPLTEKEEGEIAILPRGTLVCPGAAWPSKRLPLESWGPILEKVEGPIQFVWGNETEKAFVEKLEKYGMVLPKLTLAQLQNLMARSVRVIAMDSLPLHLCATTGTPAFAYFGPSSMQKFLPKGCHGVQGSCPFHVTFERRCPKLRSCSAPCIKNSAYALFL